MKLREENVLRAIDLSKELGLAVEGVGKHLKQLDKIGFVVYESVSTEENG